MSEREKADNMYDALRLCHRDVIAARARIEALKAERDRYREALERIIGMCDVPGRCRCGRPNGIPAVVACARRALDDRTESRGIDAG